MADREDKVYEAKLAEQAERYQDMAEIMKEVVKMDPHLSVEERNLLSVAYKNVVGARRAAWRTISSIEMKYQQQSEGAGKQKLAEKYRVNVEIELNDICGEIATLLLDHLIPALGEDDNEAGVFYYKMVADYFRYKAEFKTGSEKDDVTAQSCDHYEKAKKSSEGLPPTHPIKLGLALNYSVFKYEIMKKPEDARKLAQEAFDDAISGLDELNEDSYKDSTLIMQLLRDNLTLWSSDQEAREEEDEQQEAK